MVLDMQVEMPTPFSAFPPDLRSYVPFILSF
jgi:hypothetical protein